MCELMECASNPRLPGNSLACSGGDTGKFGIFPPKVTLIATTDKVTKSDLYLDQISRLQRNLSCGWQCLQTSGSFGDVRRKEQPMLTAYMVVVGVEITDYKACLTRQIDVVTAPWSS